MSNKRIVIAGACRTAIGKFGGSLKDVKSADLGAIVIKEALKRAGVDNDLVDEVFLGSVLQAGQGQNVARQAALKAGLPVEVPATTINVICGSGLESITTAANLILADGADVVVAGGTENMSSAPYLVKQARFGYRMGDGLLVDSMIHDGLTDALGHFHMGETAENVAERWGLTREDLDEFAKNSQMKAGIANVNEKFVDEIIPVKVREKKQEVMFSIDEAVRPETTLSKLALLKAAFKKDGIVTAGNSSGLNDGAAAVVLMSEDKAKELGAKILAYWEAGVLAGVEPDIMGVGPIASTQKVLKKLDLEIGDIDLVELNEAFAAQSLAVIHDLELNPKIVNVNGGAIALGHPLGASGARILVTLLYEMRRRKVKRGLAALCIGGGMGASAIIELPEGSYNEN